MKSIQPAAILSEHEIEAGLLTDPRNPNFLRDAAIYCIRSDNRPESLALLYPSTDGRFQQRRFRRGCIPASHSQRESLSIIIVELCSATGGDAKDLSNLITLRDMARQLRTLHQDIRLDHDGKIWLGGHANAWLYIAATIWKIGIVRIQLEDFQQFQEAIG